jgi:hypothetical protein
MNKPKDAREVTIEHRQQQEHLQQSMLNRAAAEIASEGQPNIRAEARELMVEHRQQEEQTQQSMLRRSAAEVGMKVSNRT